MNYLQVDTPPNVMDIILYGDIILYEQHVAICRQDNMLRSDQDGEHLDHTKKVIQLSWTGTSGISNGRFDTR